mmetsp:Transcript_58830/g.117716  ORF Transcript_58830/g.117716 Transcript_58830/m.117716 type:complete len:253 (+) Transcript_58830:77-835(+)
MARLLSLLACWSLPGARASSAALREKFGELQAMVEARAGTVEPELLAKVAELREQLQALERQEGVNRLSDCASMAAIRLGGASNSEVMAELKELAEGKLLPADAAQRELFRMTAVCVGNVTEQELAEFRGGNFSQLPDAYAELAAEPSAEAKVLGLDPDSWRSLADFAASALNATQPPPQQQDGWSGRPPMPILLLSVLPTVRLLRYLGKKYHSWRDRRRAEQAESKDEKKTTEKKGAAREKKKAGDSKKSQ